jgi:hypothetical protein
MAKIIAIDQLMKGSNQKALFGSIQVTIQYNLGFKFETCKRFFDHNQQWEILHESQTFPISPFEFSMLTMFWFLNCHDHSSHKPGHTSFTPVSSESGVNPVPGLPQTTDVGIQLLNKIPKSDSKFGQ